MPASETAVPMYRVLPAGGLSVIHVPRGEGEALRVHLRSHGIRALVSPAATTAYERLEIEGDADPAVIQALVDNWSR